LHDEQYEKHTTNITYHQNNIKTTQTNDISKNNLKHQNLVLWAKTTQRNIELMLFQEQYKTPQT